MKTGWIVRTIGEVCDVVNGGTPRTGVIDFWGGPHCWITPAEMGRRATPYVDDTQRTLTDGGLEESSARLLPPYSVILSSRAPIGHLVINTVPMATNQGCKGLVPRPGIDHKYLYYYLASIVDLLNDLGTGATFKELSGGKLRDVCVPVPPLIEQRRIVGILDEAFEGIAVATASAETSAARSQQLLESHLNCTFSGKRSGWRQVAIEQVCESVIDCVNKTAPTVEGPTPYLMIRTTNVRHGRIDLTSVKYASEEVYRTWTRRQVPKPGDVILTREAPLGEVGMIESGQHVFLGQRLVAYRVDTSRLEARFLLYALQAEELQSQMRHMASGATVQHMRVPDAKALEVSLPDIVEQRRLVAQTDAVSEATQALIGLYRRKLAALDELKASLLHQAFTGQLTASHTKIVSAPSKTSAMSTTDLHAGVLAIASRLHENRPPAAPRRIFGHVKAEKIAHMVEAHLGVDLGRTPVKDAAGPNDFTHLKRVEHRARKAGYFAFRRAGDASYRLTPYAGMDRLIERTRASLGDRYLDVERLIRRMAGMTKQQAEIVATVYAAWNNLLLDGQPVTDEAIVYEARESWHPDKLKIPRDKFFAAIASMRAKGITPSGQGKKVIARKA